MKPRRVVVNDLMQQGYTHLRTERVQAARPDMSPSATAGAAALGVRQPEALRL